eukprot:scaffold184532_cov27-Tisochrysis_lutea.AAC.1
MGHSRAGVEGGGLGGTEGERGKGFEKGGLAASRGKEQIDTLHLGTKTVRHICKMYPVLHQSVFPSATQNGKLAGREGRRTGRW